MILFIWVVLINKPLIDWLIDWLIKQRSLLYDSVSSMNQPHPYRVSVVSSPSVFDGAAFRDPWFGRVELVPVNIHNTVSHLQFIWKYLAHVLDCLWLFYNYHHHRECYIIVMLCRPNLIWATTYRTSHRLQSNTDPRSNLVPLEISFTLIVGQ